MGIDTRDVSDVVTLSVDHPRSAPWISWNYGLDSVRFVSIVRSSDPFRLHGTVQEVFDRSEQRHLFVLDLAGEVRGRERPGFVAVQRILWAAHDDA